MSLAAARRKANDLNDRKDGTSGKTFGELLDEWFESSIEPRYKVTKNIETYVARGKDALGSKQLSVLTTGELVDDLKRYAKDAPVAANRCLSQLEAGIGLRRRVGLPRTQSAGPDDQHGRRRRRGSHANAS